MCVNLLVMNETFWLDTYTWAVISKAVMISSETYSAARIVDVPLEMLNFWLSSRSVFL